MHWPNEMKADATSVTAGEKRRNFMNWSGANFSSKIEQLAGFPNHFKMKNLKLFTANRNVATIWRNIYAFRHKVFKH
jgi:hypothetical protein